MKFIFIALFSTWLGVAFTQGHHIEIEIKDYQNDTLVTGYFYGDRQLVHDTLIRKDGKFVMNGPETIHPGLYLAILKPANDFFQFFIPAEDQEFKLHTDTTNIQNVTFEGSQDNDLFYQYIGYISKRNKEVGELQGTRIENGDNTQLDETLKNINEEVMGYQNNIISKFPNSLTAKLIIANREIEIPDFSGSEEEKNRQRYLYYIEHYFDNLGLEDSVTLRMSYLHSKIERYVNNLTPQHPDSINKAIDRILTLAAPAPETFKFYLSHFLNIYAKSRIVGMDGVYVHLVDKYYSRGKADWVDEENLLKLEDNARMLRPTLIGRKAHDVITYRRDGSPVSLHSIEADFTILYIYAYDCGHCKKSTPPLVDFYEKNKDKSIAVFTICSKRDTAACWEYTDNYKMDGFINTMDANNTSRFRQKFDVRQTPKAYILNRNKEILIKNFPIEEIEKIMQEIMKLEMDKS